MKTKYIYPGFLFLLSIAIANCNNKLASVQDPVFLKCWTNAFEEEGSDNIRIYRSCINHTFPVSRYRNTFTLKEGGLVEYSVLGENDAHTTAEGNWTYDPKTKKLVVKDTKDTVVNEYEVVEVSDDLLKLKEK